MDVTRECMHAHQALITDWAQPCPHSASQPPPALLQLTQHNKHVDGSGRFSVFQFISSFKL